MASCITEPPGTMRGQAGERGGKARHTALLRRFRTLSLAKLCSKAHPAADGWVGWRQLDLACQTTRGLDPTAWLSLEKRHVIFQLKAAVY
jgi:hypothetical protein